MRRPRILDKFQIDELSGVDRPAQEGARAVLMKRREDDSAAPYWKRDFSDKEREAMADKGEAMPDGGFPIANATDLKNAVRAIGRAKDPDAAKKHIVTRARALGATDSLPDGWISKSDTHTNTEDVMSAQIKKALGLADTATDAEITAAITKMQEGAGKVADLEKSIALLKAKADMSDDEKDYMKSLSDKDADDFAALKPEDRKKKMAKAAEGDETFTSVTGQTISKRAVGDGVFAILKSQDEEIKKNRDEIAKANEKAANATFAKRAQDELSHLGGTIEKKASLLKAVDAMPEADRTYMGEILKAADAMAKGGFTRLGVGGDESEIVKGDAESQLNKLAKQYATDHKVTFAKAYDAVCQTDEGASLVKAYNEQRAVAA